MATAIRLPAEGGGVGGGGGTWVSSGMARGKMPCPGLYGKHNRQRKGYVLLLPARAPFIDRPFCLLVDLRTYSRCSSVGCSGTPLGRNAARRGNLLFGSFGPTAVPSGSGGGHPI